MSVAVNYYLYIARGKSFGPGNITAATASGGTAGDVELRMQIDNGTSTTGLTKEDVILALKQFEVYILSNWPPSATAGTDLPKL